MKSRIIKPDSPDQTFNEFAVTIFLAGSIDNGAATLWAQRVQDAMIDEGVTMFNPRRDEWFPDIEARASNEFFRNQVNWELDRIDLAKIIFFYFEGGSVSPITLQELGYALGKGKRVVVCCPDDFWRKGNVEIMCERADGINRVPVHSTLDEAFIALKSQIGIVRYYQNMGCNVGE
jgi:nucleoside 2-deoxyribosyltransferase